MGIEPPEEAAPPSRPLSPLHTIAISGMSLSALVGICVLFLTISVGLPEGARRASTAIVVGAGIVFLVSASTAVFSAARETYPKRAPGDPDRDPPE